MAEYNIQGRIVNYYSVQGRIEHETEYTAQGRIVSEYSVQGRIEVAEYTVQGRIIGGEYSVQGRIQLERTIPDGVLYRQYTDCTAIEIFIPDTTLENGLYNVERLELDGTITQIESVKTIVDGNSYITFVPLTDGVYYFNALDDDINMRLPILADCRIAIAFNRENDRSTDAGKKAEIDYSNWLTYYLLYRGVIASFRTEQYTKTITMIAYINENLTCSFNC